MMRAGELEQNDGGGGRDEAQAGRQEAGGSDQEAAARVGRGAQLQRARGRREEAQRSAAAADHGGEEPQYRSADVRDRGADVFIVRLSCFSCLVDGIGALVCLT